MIPNFFLHTDYKDKEIQLRQEREEARPLIRAYYLVVSSFSKTLEFYGNGS